MQNDYVLPFPPTVQFVLCFVVCSTGRRKVTYFDRKQATNLHLWTIKVAAMQDIPNYYSKIPLVSFSFKEASRFERLLQISLANSQPVTCTPGTLKATGTLLLTSRLQGSASNSAVLYPTVGLLKSYFNEDKGFSKID